MSRTEGEQPADLVRLRHRLDEYRRSSKPGKALPGWVWAAAGRLARRHGMNRTARALGLEYNKLKRSGGGPVVAAAGRSRPRCGSGAVKFLDVTSALAPAGAACRVRLAGPAGQQLELEMTPGVAKEVVLELCREGWGAQR